MTRRPSIFKQTDVDRAIRAASKHGKVAGVEVKRDGSIFIRMGEPLAAVDKGGDDDLDDVISRIKAYGETRRAR
jgi:hypothetical protein